MFNIFITKTCKINKIFQGTRAPTESRKFMLATQEFAKVYLISVEDYNDLLATIVFLKHHPDVNEQILDYAIIRTLWNRNDTSLDIASPIEVESSSYCSP